MEDRTIETYKGVKYEFFGPLAIKGVKELKAEKDMEVSDLKADGATVKAIVEDNKVRINELETENKELKDLIASLLKRIEALEQHK